MPWIRLIGWYLLAGIGLRIFGMVAMSVYYINNPDIINVFTGGRNNYLYISGLVLKNLTGLLIPLFLYLWFLGISHTIRYLLAIKETLQKSAP